MPLSLHHIALRTADVPRLAGFYRAIFAMPVVRENLPGSTWLGLAGDAVLMIESRAAAEPAPPAGSLELFAFRTDDKTRDDVRAQAKTLGCYDGETRFTVYLRDPDGRRVAVSTYDLAAREE